MADTALWQSGFLELLKRRQKRRSFVVSAREACFTPPMGLKCRVYLKKTSFEICTSLLNVFVSKTPRAL